MKAFSDDVIKAISVVAQSRNGQIILAGLKTRKDWLINQWLTIPTSDTTMQTHIRGKTSEIAELIALFESLSPSKE